MLIKRRVLPTAEEQAKKVSVAPASFEGADPKTVPVTVLVDNLRKSVSGNKTDIYYRNRVRNRATGIRAFCVSCLGGQAKRVKFCDAMECPLWPYRMGGNPFFGKKLK